MEILLHGHHRELLSVVESKAARITDIKKTKQPSQHALRLRLLQSVPLDLLPKSIVKAAKVRYKADVAWDKSWTLATKVRAKADVAWDKSWTKARDKANKARNKFSVVCQEHKPALEALHKKLCVSDCPWDGERILPG